MIKIGRYLHLLNNDVSNNRNNSENDSNEQ